MRTWLRGKSGALLTFAVIAALVVGGLGWVTQAALRLEREQGEARALADHDSKVRAAERLREQKLQALRREQAQQEAQAQADYAARLRLALWRLDSRIAPFLAREDTRPYNHYSALYTPAVVLDNAGNRRDPLTVLEPSPLLNTELPDWMLLHFQTAQATWGSPQVLSQASNRELVRNWIGCPNATTERARLLAELADPALARHLLSLVQCEDLRQMAAHDVQTTTVLPQPTPPTPQLPNKDSVQAAPWNNPDYGYTSRVQQKYQNGKETRQQGIQDDNAYAAMQNTTNGIVPFAAAKARYDAAGQVVVTLSPMVPLWLATPERRDRLLVARLVRIVPKLPEHLGMLLCLPKPGLPASLAVVALSQRKRGRLAPPKEVCQGIVLDWPRLQTLLAGEVRDLFPGARFVPMRDQVPRHPERTMTALPVEMDLGPGTEAAANPVAPLEPEPALAPPAPVALGWTPLRIGLALSWAAALVALLAVGLGGWSLIDLSERRIRFVSAVTHELRTPLTTLRLYLDMLTGGLVREEARRAEYLHTLNAETDRLSRLVGNVLDFSRLENQRPRLETSTILVAELLELVRATWQTRCGDCDKELVLDHAIAADVRLTTDVQLVQQILGNLIDNACKYSRGAEDRRIRLRARKKGTRLFFEVEDRGPGVAPREQRSIFRPFRRGGAVEVTAGGVGLGLALAQRWARLLGGRLTLERGQPGSGACFRLTLPV